MSKALQHLFDNNRAWAERMEREQPGFFSHLAAQQNPKYLWIGCPDSRVPANQIQGLDPGQVGRLSWVVAAPAGEDILLELTCNGARTSGWSIRGGTVAEAAAGGTR